MPVLHWAPRVFGNDRPKTTLPIIRPTEVFGRPDPSALQNLIRDGYIVLFSMFYGKDGDISHRYFFRYSDSDAQLLKTHRNLSSGKLTYYSAPFAELSFQREGSGLWLIRQSSSTQSGLNVVGESKWAYQSCRSQETMLLLFHTMSALKAQSPRREPDSASLPKDRISTQHDVCLFTGELEGPDNQTNILRVASTVSGLCPRIEIYASSGPMANRVVLCAFISWDIVKPDWATLVNDRTVRLSLLRPQVFVPDSWKLSADKGPVEFSFTSDIAAGMMASFDYIRDGIASTASAGVEHAKQQTLELTGYLSPENSMVAMRPESLIRPFRESGHDTNNILSVDSLPAVSQLHTIGYFGVAAKALTQPSANLNEKVCLVWHNITRLSVDAVVNAIARDFYAGGSLTTSGAILKAEGAGLIKDLKALGNRDFGEAFITQAYTLPCRGIIHAVGPGNPPNERNRRLLRETYISCLELAVENGLRTIAFPCISAGEMGFPEIPAARAAVSTIRSFLEGKDGHSIDKVVFCVFKSESRQAYEAEIP